MKNMAKKQTMRLNINVSQELIDRVDEYAERMCINRTSAIAVLLSTALDNQKVISSLEELIQISKRG